MNQYKAAWINHANMIRPQNRMIVKSSPTKSVSDNVTLGRAIGKTARAAAIAVTLSQVDGPLPFADVVALSYFSVSAAATWYDYFS
jgi:hypothetical protein